ncbi:adenylate/guanylate cyclase domain-containing protein [Niabella beijingensis]|uniref:adenylate/guanylate cyclase domain-containing protein n=1 Tax=Niabella beijingensis TaxID=2872700 RepID=UPI001CBB77D1|nr:adenylate/guanylate cyclase domain-containing protein [Niabella beijingensis]MBZ4191137.1 adenylate/guanylate cyclase domain-containing protein [Niabella beijingensis]
MRTRNSLKFRQLFIITCGWLIVGFFITLYDYLILHSALSAGPAAHYTFTTALVRNLIGGFVGALLGGSLLVFFINVRYQDKPYGYTLAAVCISFPVIIMLVTVVVAVIQVPLQTGQPLGHPESRLALRQFFNDPTPLKNALVWSFIVGITQLLLQINYKFGQNNFWNIIRGKYNTPKKEQRIFMFLDINASTTIAEQLGNERYHALLKDFFADLTPPILDSQGMIYQYVGDEIVIAWNYEEGLKNARCLKCFYDMKNHLRKKEPHYLKKYGLLPSFKAGIHCGNVIAGEVGVYKRDITYSGDVLNTTSRILNKCSELQEEFIASADVLLRIPAAAQFITKPLGALLLRGKEQRLLLNALMHP